MAYQVHLYQYSKHLKIFKNCTLKKNKKLKNIFKKGGLQNDEIKSSN